MMTTVIFEKGHDANLAAACLDLALLDKFFDLRILDWHTLFRLHWSMLQNTSARTMNRNSSIRRTGLNENLTNEDVR
jgi:hypothetical protein